MSIKLFIIAATATAAAVLSSNAASAQTISFGFEQHLQVSGMPYDGYGPSRGPSYGGPIPTERYPLRPRGGSVTQEEWGGESGTPNSWERHYGRRMQFRFGG